MRAKITVLGGDGIGPEVTAEAVRVLEAVAARFGHHFEFVEALIGGAAIDSSGSPLPPRTIDACRSSDAVLLGAVGGPKWSDPSARVRPEQGLLELRRVLGLFANLRPVRTQAEMLEASPLKPEVIAGADIMVVRELTGGIYFGRKTRTAHEAEDVCSYSAAEIERVTRVAGRLAMGRRKRIVSVDKANVLETSRLWRTVVERVLAEEFPEVQLEHMLVDAAAMHLLRRPTRCSWARSACCRRRRSARRASVSTNRSTVRRRTSQGAASPIPSARSSARRCCCATRSRSRRRRRPSRPRSARPWRLGSAQPISHRARRSASAAGPQAMPSSSGFVLRKSNKNNTLWIYQSRRLRGQPPVPRPPWFQGRFCVE